MQTQQALERVAFEAVEDLRANMSAMQKFVLLPFSMSTRA
jgi:hypothetical protein